MKPLVILNPNSQSGDTGRCAPELERVVTRYLGDVECIHTNAPRHAAELAQQAASDGRELVVGIGGDGTIHEIVNGMMTAREAGAEQLPKLGVVGQGTGGDFRKTLGLEHRLDHYCSAIASGRTKRIDVGRCSYRNHSGEDRRGYFANILSVGIGGLVDQYVAKGNGRWGGKAAYFGASVRALLKSEVGILGLTLFDGDDSHEVELGTRQIAICNGRFFGGGMEVAPMAKLDDGYFDVISMGAAPRLKFALASMSVYSGKHIEHDDVTVMRCTRIDVTLRNESIRSVYPLDVDGEPLGTLPLSIEVVPRAIDVCF